MSKVNQGWEAIDEAKSIYTYLYSFGPGLARSLAVKGANGFIVVSPPSRAPDAAFRELEERGPIAALVASNAFHHLGLGPWSKRFPEAKLFAPAQAIARVTKKTGLAGIQPLANAGDLLGSELVLEDLPHYKTGEVLVKMKGSDGPTWYVTDVIMNLPPMKGPAAAVFRLTKSAPGLRRNAVAAFFMIKDKRAVYRHLSEAIERELPSTLVPCHGPNVDLRERKAELLAELAR